MYSARFGGDMAKVVPAVATDMLVGAGTRLIAGQNGRGGPADLALPFRNRLPTPLRSVTFGATHGAEIRLCFR